MRSFIYNIAYFLFCSSAFASQNVRVGIAGQEPFVQSIPNGGYTGAAVDIWEKIAAFNQWTFSYQPFPTVDEGLSAVESGTVDVLVADAGITRSRLSHVEFSQPFFRSGLQIMIPEARPHTVGRFWRDLAELTHLSVFWYLMGAIVTFTTIVFFFERRHNPDFPKTKAEGIAEAFHNVISLALTGKSVYKGFHGIIGRLTMVGWMLLGVIVVAYVTSSITSAMTLEKLHDYISGPQDLAGKTIAVVSGSAGESYLREKGITILSTPNLERAVDAMLKHHAEAVVDDAPILQNYDFNHPQLPITEVGPIFAPQNYGFALAIGSPLRMPLNAALLELVETQTLGEILHRYFGPIYQP